MGSNKAFIEKRVAKQIKHGHKRRAGASPEYRTWLRMKRRCYDTGYKDYPNWGGRGIRLCDEWNESFDQFFADMGPRPTADHSIDRLDSNGDYAPGNCRWATSFQQASENKRNLIPVEVNGQRYQSISAACRSIGAVNYTTAEQRIFAGMSVAEAVTTPKGALPNRRTRESYLQKTKR